MRVIEYTGTLFNFNFGFMISAREPLTVISQIFGVLLFSVLLVRLFHT